MPKFIDRTGQRFTRWTVLERGPDEITPSGKGKFVTWKCKCDCGTIRNVRGSRLSSGRSWSCGCLHKEVQRARFTENRLRKTHGKTKTREFSIWNSMIQRCTNKNATSYKRYGGRGITICPQWLGKSGFETFYNDMGSVKKGFTLDRIDNNGPYSPENCQWASRKQQSNNKSNNRFITVRGITKTITEWAIKLNTTDSTIRNRIRNGWTEEEACLTPVGQTKVHNMKTI